MTRPTRLALFATILLPIQFPGCDPVLLRGAEPAPARVTLPVTARNPLNPHRPPQDVARGEGTADGPGGTVRARPLTDPAAYRPAR